MSSNSSNSPRKSAASAKNASVKSSVSVNDSIDERSENPQLLMTTNASLNEKLSMRAGAVDHHRAEGAAGKLTKLMMTRLLRLHSEAMLSFRFLLFLHSVTG
jgi:hypothetical protein